MRTQLPLNGHNPSQFSAHLRCCQTVGWIKMLLGREAGLRPGDVGESRVSAPRLDGSGCHLVWPRSGDNVLNGKTSSPKGVQPPIFGPCLLWPNDWMDQDANGTVVGLGSGDIVLDRDPAPPQKGGTVAPTFRPMYCAQMTGCINIPLGTVAGLGSGHLVLGDPAKKGCTAAPHFSSDVYCGQTAGWTRIPLGMEVGLGPGPMAQRGTTPNFRPIPVVAKLLDGSRCHLLGR